MNNEFENAFKDIYGFKGVNREQFYEFLNKHPYKLNIKSFYCEDNYCVSYLHENNIVAETITPLMAETRYYIRTDVMRKYFIMF